MIIRRSFIATGTAVLMTPLSLTVAAAMKESTACAAESVGVSDSQLSPSAYVNVQGSRREFNWPAYSIMEQGKTVDLPFSPLLITKPAGYEGDFYVDNYTDNKIRQRWLHVEQTSSKARSDALTYAINFGRRNEFRATGKISSAACTTTNFVDAPLQEIRRPSFFGKEPWKEPIAQIDDRCTIVELEVESDLNQKILTGGDGSPLKLRGWHIKGEGIRSDSGQVKALVVMLGGRGTELTAIQHPDDILFDIISEEKIVRPRSYPSTRSEKWGSRQWRQQLLDFNKEGFDVLALDYRGHGISGGINASNTYQQAMDVFRALTAFESGHNLRMIRADGNILVGPQAAGKLFDGKTAAEIPILLVGESQGSMVASHVMHANYVSRRAFDAKPSDNDNAAPYGFNIRGAVLLAEYAKGPGYNYQVSWDGISTRAIDVTEGALRERYHIAFSPSSEILAGVAKWPAVFLGRGLWDSAGALEGTLDLYHRAQGLKEIFVVRGPHGMTEAGEDNFRLMRQHSIRFAVAAVTGDYSNSEVAYPSLKELVSSTPPFWGECMRPGNVTGS